MFENLDVQDFKDEQIVAMAMARSDEAIIVTRHSRRGVHTMFHYTVDEDEALGTPPPHPKHKGR